MIHPRHALSRSLATLLATPLLATPLLVLTACSSDSSTATSPPSVVVPTPSSTTQAPTKPETADHFIRRWAAVDQRMQNTGHVSAYLALSRNCKACDALAHLVRKYYRAGGFIRWSGRKISSIEKYPAPPGHVAYAMRSVSSPTRYRESSDAPIERLKGGPITYVLTLVRTRSSFVVTDRTQLSE